MKKVKPYNFKGVDCYDLNSLAEEYIKSYKEATDDIFTNAKGLIKFVKRCRKDKAFTKEIAQILYTSKYKNNALTFIIFAFTGYGRVVINGSELSFKQFLEAFKNNKQRDNNVLYAFMEDGGISKTYANVLHEDRLTNEAEAIEANYDLPFTRAYLESYYSYKETQSFENRVSNLILANEECFRKATELCKSEDFQIALAHKIGFKEACNIHKEQNPLFESVKLLKKTNEFQDEELLKLITDTFYWWLLDNLDRYVAKGKESKALFARINEVQKKYNKYEALIKKKKIYDLALETMADMSKEMYACYLEFVSLYRGDKIVVKKKFKGYDYVFDKPYCSTFITQSFMDGRIITIDPLKEEETFVEEAENIEEANIDEPVNEDENKKKSKKEKPMKEKKSKKDKKNKKNKRDEEVMVDANHEEGPSDKLNIEKLRKKNAKNGRGKAFMTFILIIIILTFGALITVEVTGLHDFGLQPYYASEPIFYGAIGSIALLIVLLPVLSHKVKKGFKASINLEYIQNSKEALKLTPEQSKKLKKAKELENKNCKQLGSAHLILSSIIMAALSCLVACVSLLGIVMISKIDFPLLNNLELVTIMNQDVKNILFALSGATLVGLIFGFIKKYKGVFSILLVIILAALSTVGVLVLVNAVL